MKKIFLALLFIFISAGVTTDPISAASLAQSPLADYRFENNLADSANGHDATYLQDGEPGTPQFTPFGASTALSMAPAQGLRLPNSLNSAIDTGSGFEISFDFQVPEATTVDGTVYLFSAYQFNDIESPGISLIASRGEPGEPDEPLEYGIRFVYSDGRSAEDVANHEGHFSTSLGFFRLDEVMNMRLIVDFEAQTWTTIINGQLKGSPFETPYDVELIKTAVSSNPWHFGWIIDQQDEMEFSTEFFTADMILDNLQITSPLGAGNLTTLQSALNGMTEHVNGNFPRDEETMKSLLNSIYLNYRGNYANAETEIMQFIKAYEDNRPPVFNDREETIISELDAEDQALIFLQQTIFDEQFVDGNMENMAGLAYEFASIFPGPVSAEAPILTNGTATVNGTYNTMPGAPVISDFADAKRPTGYYAPPGELVTVTIPESLTDAGLKVMVGAHDSDFSGLESVNRFVRITKQIPLDSTTTTVANPFGGAIYIRVPEGKKLGFIEIGLSGVVKSPYFSTQTGLKTDLTAFQTDFENAHVLWVDLESDKNVMTLPLPHMAETGHSDPTNLLNTWDTIMDGYRFVGGRPPERGTGEYFLIDSRLPDDAFGTGYPQVIGEGSAPFGPFESAEYYPTQVFKPDFHISEFNTTLHEWGHAMFHPTPEGEVESIIHVPTSYIYDQQFGLGLDDGFKYSSHEFLSMDDTVMDWMLTHNFRNNLDMGCDPTVEEFHCNQIAYQHRGHAKYIEIARLFEWQAVYNMNKVFYDEWRANPELTGQFERDDMIRNGSQANNVNMAPLFHFWGHIPSAELNEELASLPSSPEIRNRLIEYWHIVPANAAEFEPVYQRLINGDPDLPWDGKSAGFFHEQLADVRTNYESDQYAKQMRAQICSLLEQYYPDSPAAECSQAPLDDATYLPVVVEPIEEAQLQFGGSLLIR